MTRIQRMATSRQVVDEFDAKGHRLGYIQKGVLRALLEHGAYPAGWNWDTHSHTVRVLESLVKHNLVVRTDVPRTTHRGRPFPPEHPLYGQTVARYTPAQTLLDRADELQRAV